MANQNSLKNLIAQKDALKSNVGSYGTRIRYDAGYTRFLGFVDENFHIQKIANIKDKHVYAYVENLKANGAQPTTIRTAYVLHPKLCYLVNTKTKEPRRPNGKLHIGAVGFVSNFQGFFNFCRQPRTIDRAGLPIGQMQLIVLRQFVTTARQLVEISDGA